MNKIKNIIFAIIGAVILISSLALTSTPANPALAIPACDQQCATVIRNADEPGRNPFRSQIFLSWSLGSTTVSGTFPSVPVNKRLIVEFATVEAGIPSGQNLFMNLQVSGLIYTLVLTRQADFPAAGSVGATDIYTTAQPMRIYVDAGNSIIAFANRNNSTGGTGNNIIVTISGYLVDLP